mmetsp:Transcript_23679/g.66874  ORF Transcript_23679/g.66874 Transcript_23679/m.66874 type:complete len:132 (-) Transcript_23679:129-524(-)
MKCTQKFKSLYDYYSGTKIRLRYKGLYISIHDTPNILHMKDGDVIECEYIMSPMKIVIRDQNDTEIWFKIERTRRLKVMFHHYAQLVRYPVDKFVFTFNGKQLHMNDSAQTIGLEDESVIYCRSPFPAAAA